jgi:hypothetical protein
MDNHEYLEDEVGYGKPPKHTQFKKGKSGNPKGRPSHKVLHQVIEDILNEQVTITINGEKKKMTKKEVFIQQLMTDSMKGKSTATKNLIKLLKDLYHIFPM